MACEKNKRICPLWIHDLQQLDKTSEEDVCTSPTSLDVSYFTLPTVEILSDKMHRHGSQWFCILKNK